MIIEMFNDWGGVTLVPDVCDDDVQVFDPKSNDGLLLPSLKTNE